VWLGILSVSIFRFEVLHHVAYVRRCGRCLSLIILQTGVFIGIGDGA
jgi:hypothetical protein